jgi:hypothetical protein
VQRNRTWSQLRTFSADAARIQKHDMTSSVSRKKLLATGIIAGVAYYYVVRAASSVDVLLLRVECSRLAHLQNAQSVTCEVYLPRVQHRLLEGLLKELSEGGRPLRTLISKGVFPHRYLSCEVQVVCLDHVWTGTKKDGYFRHCFLSIVRCIVRRRPGWANADFSTAKLYRRSCCLRPRNNRLEFGFRNISKYLMTTRPTLSCARQGQLVLAESSSEVPPWLNTKWMV